MADNAIMVEIILRMTGIARSIEIALMASVAFPGSILVAVCMT
jgi:hypothetical protein